MITPGHESSLVTAPGKERPTEHLTSRIVGRRRKGRRKGKKGRAGEWNGEGKSYWKRDGSDGKEGNA